MPAIGSTFRTDEPLLQDLLKDIDNGSIQLPDFQRGWVWDDEHIRSLIASVSLSYPIGAVMLLQMGGDGVRFKPRLVEGVEHANKVAPEHLILDGQQRLTSLYLALFSDGPVPTQTDKGEKIKRHYYLDMVKCLDENADRIDAVIGVPADRVVRGDFSRGIVLDLTTREKEYAEQMVPLRIVLDPLAFQDWRISFQEYYEHSRDKAQFMARFEREVWQRFQQYKVPVIELFKGTEKEAVCQVFEKVNTGGVTLSVFELVTATFAADDFSLREDWFGDFERAIEGRESRLHSHEPLKGTDAVAFLTAVTLLASYQNHRKSTANPRPAVSCKRRDVLRLSLDEYRQYADTVEKGFVKTAKLLVREKIFDLGSLPYTTQLIPLAATVAYLGDSFEQDAVKQMLTRWYWCGVFGELYGGGNETRYAQDIVDLVAWIEGRDLPRTVVDSTFSPIRLLSLQSRNSAAYKGLAVRLMQLGSRDFLSGDTIELNSYFDEAVDIHHVFPRAWCERESIPRFRWNSIVNKAALTSRTNRMIGGRAPSVYLETLRRNRGVRPEQLELILASHGIVSAHLESDSFDEFLRSRAVLLLGLVEGSTGKEVSGRDTVEVIQAFGGPLIASS